MQRGTPHMPQAQKRLSKTLLCPTDTGGFSNEAPIPTENAFYFPTANKSYFTAMSSVGPSHGALGIRAWGLAHVQDGLGASELCGFVPAERRLAVMGREAPSMGVGTDEGQQESPGGRGYPRSMLPLLPPLQQSP